MKLSILIPTHNRPALFERCLNSVLKQYRTDIEIIVNNDSKDIVEIAHPAVRYHYNSYSNLSNVYQFLLEQSTGEFVYYLEDDDYLTENFISSLEFDTDMIVGNYTPMWQPPYIFDCMMMYKDKVVNTEEFADMINYEHLQLSQHVFKRSTIANFVFPQDNNIHNDLKLVAHAATNSKTIRTTKKIFYHQTTDGNDNISFINTVGSISTIQHTDFLDEYELFKTASQRSST